MGGGQRRGRRPLGRRDLSASSCGCDQMIDRAVRLGGGQSLALDFAAGDSFAVSPAAGGRPPRILAWAFRPDGRPDPGALEWAKKTRARADEAEHARRRLFSPELADRLDFSSAPVAVAAGGDVAVRVRRDCVAALAVCGETDVARLSPSGEVVLSIRRTVAESGNRPPPPLADPRQDFLLERRTGRAYEVREGDYVQIADISGKQCSDFLAFPRAALDGGQERFIDAAVTRTMTATPDIPRPGLCDSFFDQDVRPLMRVVRDTCGRHDTFGVACAGPVYDRKGHLDHPNCSDNISAAMAEWGVLPRRAWPAVNFFYNTSVAGGVLAGGEGWSRAGDYVLLRALTDLICVSTACPDDTSPINGWDPTDIQIRVYPKTARFRRAVAFRARPDSPPTLTRETGFHPRTEPLARDYAAAGEFWIPRAFSASAPADEYWACREKATAQDLSQLRKFDIAGPDAERLMDFALPRAVCKLAPDAAAYSPMCRAHGAMFDDGILMRLGPDGFRWMCGDPRAGEWLEKIAAEKKFNARVRDITARLCNLAIQGPESRSIADAVVAPMRGRPKVADLGRFRFLAGRLRLSGGREGAAVLLSRTGYTGQLGYEIFCAPADAPPVWDAAQKAGKPRGMIPMGLNALEILRVEAGLPAGGREFGGDEDIDPFEAGVGFAVSADKGDFVGKPPLLRSAKNPRRVLVGLILEDAETPPFGAPVFSDETSRAGVVTSAVRSPSSGKVVALARLAAEFSAPSTRLEVGALDGFQKRLPAVVSPPPFHRAREAPRRPRARKARSV